MNKNNDFKNEYIEKPIPYFKKVVKNMDYKELKKLNTVYKSEISMELCDFDSQLTTNQKNTSEIDKYFNDTDSLLWIEYLDNKEIYYATKKLKYEDVMLLHLWINQRFTQKEIASIMNMKEKTVNKRLTRIRKKLRSTKY